MPTLNELLITVNAEVREQIKRVLKTVDEKRFMKLIKPIGGKR